METASGLIYKCDEVIKRITIIAENKEGYYTQETAKEAKERLIILKQELQKLYDLENN